MSISPHKIEALANDVAGFIGVSPVTARPQLLQSLSDYQRMNAVHASPFLSHAIRGFFENGGARCYVAFAATADFSKALDALAKERISLLACPDSESFAGAAKFLVAHCEKLKDRICVLHAPSSERASAMPRPPVQSSFAAFYHPWVEVTDGAQRISVPPDGHVMGALAHAGTAKVSAQAAAALRGVDIPAHSIEKVEAEALSAHGVNGLRSVAGQGILLWGARTTSTDPDWKYIAVRRLAIFLEQSIQNGLQWVVFEPNGEALWANVRQTISDFLSSIWQDGALLGAKPQQAFFVHCDRSTMTQADIDSGNLIAVIGIAPLKPAEFVILRIGAWGVKPSI